MEQVTIKQPLSCPITVVRKNGYNKPVTHKTVPIRELIVDDEFYYKLVKNHVFECDKCDPVAILQSYLDRRRNMYKFNGFTSATLTELALQYRRKFGDKIPKELITEFIWRSGYSSTLIKYEKWLSNMDIWRAINLLRINVKDYPLSGLRSNYRFRLIESLMDGKQQPKTDKEIEDLMTVVDVMIV